MRVPGVVRAHTSRTHVSLVLLAHTRPAVVQFSGGGMHFANVGGVDDVRQPQPQSAIDVHAAFVMLHVPW